MSEIKRPVTVQYRKEIRNFDEHWNYVGSHEVDVPDCLHDATGRQVGLEEMAEYVNSLAAQVTVLRKVCEMASEWIENSRSGLVVVGDPSQDLLYDALQDVLSPERWCGEGDSP